MLPLSHTSRPYETSDDPLSAHVNSDLAQEIYSFVGMLGRPVALFSPTQAVANPTSTLARTPFARTQVSPIVCASNDHLVIALPCSTRVFFWELRHLTQPPSVFTLTEDLLADTTWTNASERECGASTLSSVAFLPGGRLVLQMKRDLGPTHIARFAKAKLKEYRHQKVYFRDPSFTARRAVAEVVYHLPQGIPLLAYPPGRITHHALQVLGRHAGYYIADQTDLSPLLDTLLSLPSAEEVLCTLPDGSVVAAVPEDSIASLYQGAPTASYRWVTYQEDSIHLLILDSKRTSPTPTPKESYFLIRGLGRSQLYQSFPIGQDLVGLLSYCYGRPSALSTLKLRMCGTKATKIDDRKCPLYF